MAGPQLLTRLDERGRGLMEYGMYMFSAGETYYLVTSGNASTGDYELQVDWKYPA